MKKDFIKRIMQKKPNNGVFFVPVTLHRICYYLFTENETVSDVELNMNVS